MSIETTKYNLLTEAILTNERLFAFSDANGNLFRTDFSKLASAMEAIGVSGFKNTINKDSIAPTEDGIYVCTNSGTYTNFGLEVVDLDNTFVMISVESNQTSFIQVQVPLTYPLKTTFDKTNNIDGATMKAIDDYYQPKITKNSDDIGDKTTLTTTDKSSTVAAINEVEAKSKANENTIGTYTDPEGQGDLSSDVVELYNLVSTAQSTANTADGKADTNATNIGNKATLTTTDKTNTVAAINEVNATANTTRILAILSL